MKKKIISMLLALSLVTGLLVASGLANQMAGYSMAKYDLFTNKPKYFVYGLVKVRDVKEHYTPLGIKPVFRGCIVGGYRYLREMSYNREIGKHFPQVAEYKDI